MLSWLTNPADEAFAKKLAQNLERKFPPPVIKSRIEKINIQRLGDIFENVLSEATTYSRNEKPNFIRRTKIANDFRSALEKGNYPNEFIAEITKALIIYMSKK